VDPSPNPPEEGSKTDLLLIGRDYAGYSPEPAARNAMMTRPAR
jgi:hypothetical protein